MKYTIKDVAKAAGVSLGTVSNVLNHNAAVSDANRERVLRAVQELNYNPNYVARALKTRRSKSFGLIIPNIENPFYPEFARGVEDSARLAGYNLFLCNGDRNQEKERNYINALIEKMVDGIILFKTQMSLEDLTLVASKMPLILVDMAFNESLNCGIVRVDDYQGIRKALDFLWQRGHRKIAMIAGAPDSRSSHDRVTAYRDFYQSNEIPVTEGFIQFGHYDWHSGYRCTSNLLNRIDPPTAIMAANDLMAIGTVKAIHERGLRVPGDISVMGYDDIDIASLCTPALTTVRQPKYEMGQSSVAMLLKRIQEGGDAPEEIVLNTEIISRESVYSL